MEREEVEGKGEEEGRRGRRSGNGKGRMNGTESRETNRDEWHGRDRRESGV